VLMVAWMNDEALRKTLETRRAHYWSRTRQALWEKGATSGHGQHVEAVYADCDSDTLLVLVHQQGVACHTGSRTCFVTRLLTGAAKPEAWPDAGILDALERTIQSRKVERRPGSYVAGLLAKGDAAVLKKVGEEAAEVVVAAAAETRDRLVAEVADLWFHTLVLLGARGIPLGEVWAELARRHRPEPDPE
jgi:phosphoribosyl-ATP pyrophosphohydrolase/phosphoribosyl-AMP cyclohydrolase